MSIQKRRIVYFTDEEWAEVRGRASARDMTASAYLRSAGLGTQILPVSVRNPMAEFRPAPKPSAKKAAS